MTFFVPPPRTRTLYCSCFRYQSLVMILSNLETQFPAFLSDWYSYSIHPLLLEYARCSGLLRTYYETLFDATCDFMKST